MYSEARPYWVAVTLNVFRAIFWPDNWWVRVWHYFIILGAWFAPEIREFLEMRLAAVGISGLENRHYYTLAALLAIITLAVELARLHTARILPIGVRHTEDGANYYVKLTIQNLSGMDCTVWVQLRLLADRVPYSVAGRDCFVLLTQQRAAERKAAAYDSSMRRRFHLNKFEKKDLELLTIGKQLTKATCQEELGEIDIPLKNYDMEIVINGGTRPWAGKISMRLEQSAISFEPDFNLDLPNVCLNKVPS